MSTNALRAEAPRRAKSASLPVPPSSSGRVVPPTAVPVENGIAATRGLNRTPSPLTTAVAERSSHRPGTTKASLRAATLASRKR